MMDVDAPLHIAVQAPHVERRPVSFPLTIVVRPAIACWD